MAGSWARTRAAERVAALGAVGLADRDLRREVLAVLRGALDFGAYVWLLTDPVTKVGTAPLAEVPCLDELPALIKAKYAAPVNRWTALLRQASPAGLLSRAADDELAGSRAWRELIGRYRIRDVASVVFADHHGCWGFLDLWREDTQGCFRAADAEFLAGLAAPLASALRGCQARTFAEPAAAHQRDAGPVVLTLDDSLRIVSRTAASQAWLNVLLPPGPGEQAIPAAVYNVAAQLLAAEAGTDSHPAYARAHLTSGFWLAIRAARLSVDQDPGAPARGGATIAVTIEEASAADRLDLFTRAFGLTAREHQMLALLATGSDTRAMARQLSLSELTVQDHLKSVFAKTGVRDRVALLSRALGTRR
jgi:DNA-binding CsgD family transcriptional regulator